MMRLALVLLAATTAGCGLARSVAVDLVYDEVAIPDENVRRDLAYLPEPAPAEAGGDPKHRLNLFLPVADSVRQRPWPVVVFVHGGGWTEGDKDLTYGGEDLYNNIGRFLAQRGIGAATVSYRLMPGVTWREQVEDVGAAVRYLHETVSEFGGDADGVVLMGHSAGAYLASFVALAPDVAGVAPGVVCGAIPVSGAALDLTDRETYLLRDNFDYYSARFSPDRVARDRPPAQPEPWQREASPVTYVSADDPPFLVLYAGGETDALQRQSRLLDAALAAAGVESRAVVVPGKSHERIVPTLSRDDQTAGPAILDFVRGLDCR